jgi:hypothetical protein
VTQSHIGRRHAVPTAGSRWVESTAAHHPVQDPDTCWHSEYRLKCVPAYHPNFDYKRLEQPFHRSCMAFSQDGPDRSIQIARMLSGDANVGLAFGHGDQLRVSIAKLR